MSELKKRPAEAEDLPEAADKPSLLHGFDAPADPEAGAGARDLLDPENFKSQPAEGRGEGDLLAASPADPEPANEPTKTEPQLEAGTTLDGMPTADDPVAAVDGDEMEDEGTWSVAANARSVDDPLLGCLTILCTLLDRPFSSDALTAGLPMIDGQMTPELFVRASERAGISARLVRRRINGLNRIGLPCVMLLNGKRACVLTDLHKGGIAEIILPEMGSGSQRVPLKQLAGEYAGYVLFARP